MSKNLRFLYIPILCLSIVIPGALAKATGNINQLQNQSNVLQQEIANQQQSFVTLMVQINAIEEEIAINEGEIAEAEQNLADARVAEAEQYDQMCKRIRYNYENKEDSIFTYILTAQSITDFLNQIEYANSIYEYDSQMLDSYEATRIEIEELRADLEAQKASLALKKDGLAKKRAELAALIEATKAKKADVDQELAAARAEAARRAAEERAAREAARRAAAEAAARAAANAAASGNKNNNGGSTGKNIDPAPVTNVSGAAVVSYANQFVGNSYKWGGNSLTDGVDCSGFVVQVYKHFGINLSGSRNSSALRSVGRAVSYDSMKAGDIVCYSGHVGIYTGAGTIVEAQSTSRGITNNRSVNNKTILAIRRVI